MTAKAVKRHNSYDVAHSAALRRTLYVRYCAGADGGDPDGVAELVDMEFVQFHPTGMIWPPGARGILVTEAVRGEGGRLYNSLGERFMETYDPKKMELSSRDVVARSIYKEVQVGRGSPHGGAFLDVRHRGAEYIHKRLPSMYEQFHALASVDITREPMEVGPTIHYTMGGVRVDAETAATSVPGLYAAGEVTGGLHGANRLGGNSLGDILVFGKRAGDAAAEFARSQPQGRIDAAQVARGQQEMLAYLVSGDGAEGENPYLLHEALQEAMQDDAGIARTGESLTRSLNAVLALTERAGRMTGRRLADPQPRVAHLPRRRQHADRQRGDRARCTRAAGEPRLAVAARPSGSHCRAGPGELRDRPRRHPHAHPGGRRRAAASTPPGAHRRRGRAARPQHHPRRAGGPGAVAGSGGGVTCR